MLNRLLFVMRASNKIFEKLKASFYNFTGVILFMFKVFSKALLFISIDFVKLYNTEALLSSYFI